MEEKKMVMLGGTMVEATPQLVKAAELSEHHGYAMIGFSASARPLNEPAPTVDSVVEMDKKAILESGQPLVLEKIEGEGAKHVFVQVDGTVTPGTFGAISKMMLMSLKPVFEAMGAQVVTTQVRDGRAVNSTTLVGEDIVDKNDPTGSLRHLANLAGWPSTAKH